MSGCMINVEEAEELPGPVPGRFESSSGSLESSSSTDRIAETGLGAARETPSGPPRSARILRQPSLDRALDEELVVLTCSASRHHAHDHMPSDRCRTPPCQRDTCPSA